MRIKYLAACSAVAAVSATFSSARRCRRSRPRSGFNADVAANCTIRATDLEFTGYDRTGSNLDAQETVWMTCTSISQEDAQSQISLNCMNHAEWNIGLSSVTFAGATVTTRKMTGPSGSSMADSLYRDAVRTFNWGNAVGTNTLADTGTGSVQMVPVYGRVPASQTLPPGSYRDTIIATVTF